MDYEKEINKIQFKHLEKFTKKLFDRAFIEGLAFGNLNHVKLKKTVKEFSQKLGITSQFKKEQNTNSVRQISPGESHTIAFKLQEDNFAILTEYQTSF